MKKGNFVTGISSGFWETDSIVYLLKEVILFMALFAETLNRLLLLII